MAEISGLRPFWPKPNRFFYLSSQSGLGISLSGLQIPFSKTAGLNCFLIAEPASAERSGFAQKVIRVPKAIEFLRNNPVSFTPGFSQVDWPSQDLETV